MYIYQITKAFPFINFDFYLGYSIPGTTYGIVLSPFECHSKGNSPDLVFRTRPRPPLLKSSVRKLFLIRTVFKYKEMALCPEKLRRRVTL
jgi:hypothetical protein